MKKFIYVFSPVLKERLLAEGFNLIQTIVPVKSQKNIVYIFENNASMKHYFSKEESGLYTESNILTF